MWAFISTIPVPLMTLIVSLVIGIGVVWIAYNQLKVAESKLKLDLYNKRFQIYVAAVDLYHGVMKLESVEIEKLQMAFVKSVRESKFLFAESDGIYSALKDIQNAAHDITAYNSLPKEDRGSAYPALADKKSNAIVGFEGLLLALEEKMHKYLNFDTFYR